MEKTIICQYWENKNCKFMKDSSKCSFSHGMEDINKIFCRYGINCYNANCVFYHGNETTIPNMVYEFPIIDKRKNKKNKDLNKKVINNLDNGDIPLKEDISCKYKKIEIQNVCIINKNKGINDIITVFNTDINKTLSIIDEFYIEKYNTMINNKNKHIRKIAKNNYENILYLRNIINKKNITINKIQSENLILKKAVEELNSNNESLKKYNTKIDMVDIKKIKRNENKLKNLYDKYINLYNIFKKYNNYKLINTEEIKKYTKDKNIYKIKQRSYKVYNYYEKYKKGIINELLPISRIINMVF